MGTIVLPSVKRQNRNLRPCQKFLNDDAAAGLRQRPCPPSWSRTASIASCLVWAMSDALAQGQTVGLDHRGDRAAVSHVGKGLGRVCQRRLVLGGGDAIAVSSGPWQRPCCPL